MVKTDSFTLEHIRDIQRESQVDVAILERSIFALALQIGQIGMPFIFKGGTSLLLLLEKPRRLSTDIDISVEVGTDYSTTSKRQQKSSPSKRWNNSGERGRPILRRATSNLGTGSPLVILVQYGNC